MSVGDVLTLAGLVVAVFAIAIPPWERERKAQKRFRENIYYRLEGSADVAALTARQVLDLDTGAVLNPQDLSADMLQALIRALRNQGGEILAAVAEDAAQVHARLSTRNELEAWHLMMANMRVSLDRDMSDPRSLLGTALQVYCTAYISLVVLGIKYERDEALNWLRIAVNDSSGPGSRMRVFATALLPEEILKQIAEPKGATE